MVFQTAVHEVNMVAYIVDSKQIILLHNCTHLKQSNHEAAKPAKDRIMFNDVTKLGSLFIN